LANHLTLEGKKVLFNRSVGHIHICSLFFRNLLNFLSANFPALFATPVLDKRGGAIWSHLFDSCKLL